MHLQTGSVAFFLNNAAAAAAADAMLCCGHGELLQSLLDCMLTRAANCSALARVCCDILKRCIRYGTLLARVDRCHLAKIIFCIWYHELTASNRLLLPLRVRSYWRCRYYPSRSALSQI